MTGHRPILERIAILEHADFFIGLASGLSWLAWELGVPVVQISGFTLPGSEFYTPYRVQNVMVMDRESGEYMPLDLEKIYTLASHNYMLLNQGDGFAMFGRNNVTILQEDVMIDNAVLINYIQTMPGNDEYEHVVQGYEDPYGEGRIVIVDSEEPLAPGDVNGDGSVDIEDALLAMRAALELVDLPDAGMAAADVNGDGSVTLVDALIILRRVLGLM